MVKTKKKTFECEDCGKILRSARGLAGHMWFAHQKRYGVIPNLKEEIKLLQEEKGANPDSIKRIENIEDNVEELLAMVKDLVDMVKQIVELIPKQANPGNQGNPGKPGNPQDPGAEKKKTDEEEDDGLPDIITPFAKLLGIEIEEESDDDDSIFL